MTVAPAPPLVELVETLRRMVTGDGSFGHRGRFLWSLGSVLPVTGDGSPGHRGRFSRSPGTVLPVTGDGSPGHRGRFLWSPGTVPSVTSDDRWSDSTALTLRLAESLPTLEDGVAEAFQAFVDQHFADAASGIPLPDLAVAAEAFRVHQAFQAWQQHGAWVEAHPDALRGAAGEPFAAASGITVSQDEDARATLAELRAELDAALGDAVLVLPSAAGPAPRVWASAAEVDAHRQATFRLTCIAGITGRPAVSAPLLTTSGGPLGICLVGPRGSDEALIELAASLV